MPDNLSGADQRSPVVLLLIDVINDCEFPGGEQLIGPAEGMARAVAQLKQRAKAAGVACVYVNDNFGRWRSDFRQILDHCLHDGVRGERLAALLAPEQDDYFILKPRNSAFFCSALDILLEHLGARILIITGVSANLCVLFTANDAHMRGYKLVVPPDCVAAERQEDRQYALELMEAELGVELRSSQEIDFRALCASS